MNRLLILLALLLAVPALAQEQRPARPDLTSERARSVDDLREHAYTPYAPRYAPDPATGRMALTPEGRAALGDQREAHRAELLREIAQRPGPARGGLPAPQPESSGGTIVLTVNSAYDNPDETPGDGICKIATYNECTLRAAIQEATAQPAGQDVTIEFGITVGPIAPSASGQWTIPVGYDDGSGSNGDLPYADKPDLIIDGSTQSGAVCGFPAAGTPSNLKVYIDGGLVAGGVGLDSVTENLLLMGVLVRYFDTGLSIAGPGSQIVCSRSYNSGAGAVVYSHFGNVGAPITAERSTFSGNTQEGIYVLYPGTEIRDNIIGLDASGLSALGNGGSGVFASADDVVVDGNVVSANGFADSFYGIHLTGAQRAQVTDNIVGLSWTGASAGLGNSDSGIYVTDGASDNDIGLPGAGNLVGDNFEGILLDGAGTDDNRVRGNTVGLDAAGNAAGNGTGIRSSFGSSGSPERTLIGGSLPGEGNIVSGNEGVGIVAGDAEVIGNVVGLNALDAPRPNREGVAPLGDTRIFDNTISGNTQSGILAAQGESGILAAQGFAGGGFVFIRDNRIGTTPDGMSARGNGLHGVEFEAWMGGLQLINNTIAANGLNGVSFLLDSPSFSTIIQNRVGVAADGTTPLGNGSNGFSILSGIPLIGSSTASNDGNVIAHNGGDGVAGWHDTALLRNDIHSNGGLGIDAGCGGGCSGVTPNDSPDADGVTNYPVLTSVENDGEDAHITLTLDALPNQEYRIEFFTSPTADPSGYGEGQTYRTALTRTTNGSGSLSATITRQAAFFPVGSWVAATATVKDGTSFRETSEFSAVVQVTDISAPPLTLTLTPTNPAPPVTLARGARLFYDATFVVGATGPSSFEYWAEAVLPNGSTRALFGPVTVSATPGTTVTLSLQQRVPNGAPLGNYTFRMLAGTFPGTVLTQDSFPVTVTASEALVRRGDEHDEAWTAYAADGSILEAGLVQDLRVQDLRVAPDDAASVTAPAASSTTGLPEAFALHAAAPNPSAGRVTLRFDLPEAAPVRLVVYDALGREVAVLVDETRAAGRYSVPFHGRALPSGVYLVRLVTDGQAQTQRLTLLR